MSLFNIGVSGLKTQQAALNVVGQNITNAGTAGYTRQRADIESIVSSSAGPAAGAGARVANVERISNGFVAEQIRSDVASFAELDAFGDRIRQLETGLFDGQFGIDSAMREFFDAMQDAAGDPADLSKRAFVLDTAQGMVHRFNGLQERITSQALDVTTAMESAALRVNEIANVLVGVNERITGLQSGESSSALNSLLDKRDVLVKEMSQYVAVQTAELPDGQVNVFIGKGQPLVLGQDRATLSVSQAGEVSLQSAGGQRSEVITDAISGGELSGLIKYRDNVLEPTQAQIGQMAAALSVAFNRQHSLGVDLAGAYGTDFFRDVNDPNLVGSRVGLVGGQPDNGSSVGQVNVYIDDPLAASATNYVVSFSENNVGSFEVKRTDNGEVVFHGSSFSIPQQISFEGIRVEFASGEVNPGDQFLVTPYNNSAAEFDVAITDAAELALASPVVVQADSANSGSAQVTVREIFDANHPLLQGDTQLLPPLLVEFVNETQYRVLDNSDPSHPRALDPDLGLMSIVPGGQNHLLPHELGTTLVTTSGPQVSALQTTSGFVNSTAPLTNGYPQGSFSVALGQGASEDQSTQLSANQSARQTAAQLNSLSGIEASARTELEISGLVNYQDGTPVELFVNGEVFTGFADLAELADQINGNGAMQNSGVQAVSDGTTLQLVASNGDDLSLHFQGDPNESITLTSTAGEQAVLRGSIAGSYSTATIGGTLSVLVAPGSTVAADFPGIFASEPEHIRADFGFDVVLQGNVNAGDRFNLVFNRGGEGDNRNALALASLGDQALIGDPARSLYGTYANVVQSVGVQAGQANINKEAAASLLAQSEAFRESISGVNLDEEAAALIRHEQAYNASAQIISVARDVFNVLLNSVS